MAPYLPFAADFEDGAGYGPIVSRLLFYAELSAARDTRYGTYSKPHQAPQTYGQLQKHVFALREQHNSGMQVQRRVETADDLATMLQEFASGGTVLRALQDFALPPHRHKKAVSVERLLQSTSPGKLKTTDDSVSLQYSIRLTSSAAARIAEAFLEFLQQGQLTARIAAMSCGQLLSLCLLHSRLSWQKGKPLQFRETLQYCLPKPPYVPATAVPAPSPAHFVEQVRADGADAAPPQHTSAAGVHALRERLHRPARTLGPLRRGAPQLGGSSEARAVGDRAAAGFADAPGVEEEDPRELHAGADVLEARAWPLWAHQGVHAATGRLRDVRSGRLDRRVRAVLLIQRVP